MNSLRFKFISLTGFLIWILGIAGAIFTIVMSFTNVKLFFEGFEWIFVALFVYVAGNFVNFISASTFITFNKKAIENIESEYFANYQKTQKVFAWIAWRPTEVRNSDSLAPVDTIEKIGKDSNAYDNLVISSAVLAFKLFFFSAGGFLKVNAISRFKKYQSSQAVID